jgi:hypothetical protein
VQPPLQLPAQRLTSFGSPIIDEIAPDIGGEYKSPDRAPELSCTGSCDHCSFSQNHQDPALEPRPKLFSLQQWGLSLPRPELQHLSSSTSEADSRTRRQGKIGRLRKDQNWTTRPKRNVDKDRFARRRRPTSLDCYQIGRALRLERKKL